MFSLGYTSGLLQYLLTAIGDQLKKHIQDNLKVDLEKKKCMFDEYIPSELQEVITKQHKIIEYQKKNDHNKLHSILINVDLMTLLTQKRFQETRLY